MKHKPFTINTFLSTLYALSNRQFGNQPEWFRELFFSYHLDRDKLNDRAYLISQNAISEFLVGKAKFPTHVFQFYFASRDGTDMLYDDIAHYLYKVAFTEGRRQKYIETLFASVNSSAIHPLDKEYILSSPSNNNSMEYLAEICYRIMRVLV